MTASLHVESVGEGPPLVLLHGWGMHSGLWGSLPARLAPTHRVHAVDLPGHGHSREIPIETLERVAARVADCFREERTVQVLGWSLGALVAMQWALLTGEQVAGLVLTGATPRFVRAPDWPHGIDEAVLLRFGDELRAAYQLTLQRFLALQLQGSDDVRTTLPAMRRTLVTRGAPSPESLARGLDILHHADLRARLHEITPPTLVIAGDRDTLTPVAAGRALATELPGGELRSIAGAAHVAFLSHPVEFTTAVAGFLR
ncbi:MAG: pimeloyl-ACP methyl ester esterase BioH [Pseudomonadota bacterium]|nr:pimeloyl-ACP methyl ester esterase BioH [Pseudomonadota bacterium]